MIDSDNTNNERNNKTIHTFHHQPLLLRAGSGIHQARRVGCVSCVVSCQCDKLQVPRYITRHMPDPVELPADTRTDAYIKEEIQINSIIAAAAVRRIWSIHRPRNDNSRANTDKFLFRTIVHDIHRHNNPQFRCSSRHYRQ